MENQLFNQFIPEECQNLQHILNLNKIKSETQGTINFKSYLKIICKTQTEFIFFVCKPF